MAINKQLLGDIAKVMADKLRSHTKNMDEKIDALLAVVVELERRVNTLEGKTHGRSND